MARQIKRGNRIEASSGNVFADLGLSNAVELDTKMRLVVAINQLLKSRRMGRQRLLRHSPSINLRYRHSSIARLAGFLWNDL